MDEVTIALRMNAFENGSVEMRPAGLSVVCGGFFGIRSLARAVDTPIGERSCLASRLTIEPPQIAVAASSRDEDIAVASLLDKVRLVCWAGHSCDPHADLRDVPLVLAERIGTRCGAGMMPNDEPSWVPMFAQHLIGIASTGLFLGGRAARRTP